jgi:AcrR family transcriptional regulator
MDKPDRRSPPDPGSTREVLIGVAMRMFGREGFAATSTRALAAAARTNSASIAYHFGSKEGLRLACAETIVARLRSVFSTVAVGEQALPDNPETAARQMESMVAAMAFFILTRPEAEDIAPFLLREMSAPSAAIDRIYADVMRPMHMHACVLWAIATGADAEDPQTRLRVFTIIGQLLYFRIGRELVTRRMGWDTIDAGEANQIVAIITANLRALIEAARRDRQGKSS